MSLSSISMFVRMLCTAVPGGTHASTAYPAKLPLLSVVEVRLYGQMPKGFTKSAMTSFAAALDDACDSRAAKLGRDLHQDEAQELEDALLADWIRNDRFDDLIDHALDEFELRDGEAFCASIGNALAKIGDRTRFERLFLGLAKSRERACWRLWPNALNGHVGAMKESAQHFAQVQAALAGLYHCYWAIGDKEGQERTKAAMLRLQSREGGPVEPRAGHK